ncbi:hypothetical protein CVIRNUC_010705 [Coccomyxa viridis]|uniref:Protein kinase A anchor protein nuclear localisation signal domain-containing protein n=1 Tax=Coccomyxa viridis TaxID=1274662 RepID=A0AAV1IMK9_9CHLO|nr:hypothetical protein CVIRNUC_010705 [Coccomyxa viridis]
MAKSPSAQQELDRMMNIYEKMADSLEERGLDVASIAAVRPHYSIKESGTCPLQLTELPEPLPPTASRLAVLPLSHCPIHVAAIAEIVQSIRSLLPPGTDVFCNPPELLHITLFHMSHPHDPRPCPLDGQASERAAGQPAAQRRAPTEAEIHSELALMPHILGGRAISNVKVDRIQMASSGVLLMLSADHDGTITNIRSRFHACAPGCPVKQTNIVHSSLLRILTPEQLSKGAIFAINQVCQQWTNKLRGTQLSLPEAWYIVEDEYANIRGKTYSFSVPADGTAGRVIQVQPSA